MISGAVWGSTNRRIKHPPYYEPLRSHESNHWSLGSVHLGLGLGFVEGDFLILSIGVHTLPSVWKHKLINTYETHALDLSDLSAQSKTNIEPEKSLLWRGESCERSLHFDVPAVSSCGVYPSLFEWILELDHIVHTVDGSEIRLTVNHLECITSCKERDIYHINWWVYRISEPFWVLQTLDPSRLGPPGCWDPPTFGGRNLR